MARNFKSGEKGEEGSCSKSMEKAIALVKVHRHHAFQSLIINRAFRAAPNADYELIR